MLACWYFICSTILWSSEDINSTAVLNNVTNWLVHVRVVAVAQYSLDECAISHNADWFHHQDFQENKSEDICNQYSLAAAMLLNL